MLTWEAAKDDHTKETEKVQPMIRILSQILRDHLEGRLENRIQYR